MILYLNNSGHRWVDILPNGKRNRVQIRHEGKIVSRAVIYWEAIGNFAVPYVKLNGKLVQLSNNSREEGVWIKNPFSK